MSANELLLLLLEAREEQSDRAEAREHHPCARPTIAVRQRAPERLLAAAVGFASCDGLVAWGGPDGVAAVVDRARRLIDLLRDLACRRELALIFRCLEHEIAIEGRVHERRVRARDAYVARD